MTFAHTLGEFGVVLMIGGNLSGETRTVSVAIYDAVQALDYTTAGQTSALLVALSFVTLLALYTTRGGTPWASRSFSSWLMPTNPVTTVTVLPPRPAF